MLRQLLDERMIKIHNIASFTEYIEHAVKLQEVTYLEAISQFCKETGLDIENIPRLISPQIKDKLEVEAHELNMFRVKKRRRKLPIED